MLITKRYFLSLAVLAVLFFFSAHFAPFNKILSVRAAGSDLWSQQQGMKDIGTKFGQSAAPRDIRLIAAKIIKIFLGLLGIIFVVLLVSAGYKWMTAAGNDDKVKEARGQITTAVIGLLVILAAYSITSFVIDRIIKAAEWTGI